MFKKIVSYAVIFSILYPNIARCMDPEEGPRQRTLNISLEIKENKDLKPEIEKKIQEFKPNTPEIKKTIQLETSPTGNSLSPPQAVTKSKSKSSSSKSDEKSNDSSPRNKNSSKSSSPSNELIFGVFSLTPEDENKSSQTFQEQVQEEKNKKNTSEVNNTKEQITTDDSIEYTPPSSSSSDDDIDFSYRLPNNIQQNKIKTNNNALKNKNQNDNFDEKSGLLGEKAQIKKQPIQVFSIQDKAVKGKDEKNLSSQKNKSLNTVELLQLNSTKQQLNLQGDRPQDDPDGDGGDFCIMLNDSKVRAYLLYVNYLIEGKPTWKQFFLGGLGGGLIGLGVGNAMPPILLGGLLDIARNLNIMRNEKFANWFTAHTAISLGIDSQSRNIRIIGQLTGPSTKEFSVLKSRNMSIAQKVVTLVAGGVIGLTAGLLPVYYLWDFENAIIKKDPTHRTNYLLFFGCLSPTLWLDTILMSLCPIKDWIDRQINTTCAIQTYNDHQYTAESRLRKQKLEQFENLKAIFKHMTEEEIRNTYTDLFLSKEHKEYGDLLKSQQVSYWQKMKQFFSCENDPVIETIEETLKNIKAKESLLVLKKLDEIYKQHANSIPLQEEGSQEGTATVTTLLQGELTLFATPLRGFILGYSLDFILSSLGCPIGWGKITLAILAGQGIGSFFQGALEFDTIGKALSELSSTLKTMKKLIVAPWDTTTKALSKALSESFPQEEKQEEKGWGSSIYRGIRGTCALLWKGTEPLRHTYLYAQAAENAWPYLLTGLKATKPMTSNYFTSTLRILGLSLSGLAEVFNNKISFSESYGGVYDFIERVSYTYFITPSPSYMRKRTMNLIEKLQLIYPLLHPEVVKDESIFLDKMQVCKKVGL